MDLFPLPVRSSGLWKTCGCEELWIVKDPVRARARRRLVRGPCAMGGGADVLAYANDALEADLSDRQGPE
jgi:hypothetical protein